MHALKLTSILGGFLFILLSAKPLTAQDTRFGNGDFCVYLNDGENVAHIGGWNTLEIHIANDALLMGMSPAIEININAAFSWDMGYGSHPPVNEEGRAVGAWDNMTGLMIMQDFDDASPEHISIGGAAIPGGGIPEGPSEICYSLRFYIPGGESPQTSGITVQPYFYPPAMTWTFADEVGTYPPDFCGQPVTSEANPEADPVYFDIVENMPPIIEDGPTQPLQGHHCDPMSHQFHAADLEENPYWFELVSGPGEVDSVAGLWSYNPEPWEIGIHTAEIRACDAYGCGPVWTWEIIVTNDPPVLTGGCGATLFAQVGQILYHSLEADAIDCDPLTFTIEGADPWPTGWSALDPATGEFVFEPELSDTGLITFYIRVDDGTGDYDACSFDVVVRSRGVVINEVGPWSDYPDDGDTVSTTVELYNAGTSAQDLSGWSIAGNSAADVIWLPGWTIPPGAYLIIDFALGTDDPDFSTDGVATYYAGNTSWTLDEYGDEIGLYSGLPGVQTLVDFVGWGRGNSTFGDAYSHALQKNAWPVNGFVELDGESLLGTFGRIPSGYDTDIPDDWRAIETPRATPSSPDNPIQLRPFDGLIAMETGNLVWRAVHGASSYLLEVDIDSTFSSPFISLTLGDTTHPYSYPEGLYYWRVHPDLPGDPYPAAEWLFAVDTMKALLCDSVLVPQKYQHKDSRLLCIWNERKGVRPGCDKDDSHENGPWDNEHDTTVTHIKVCQHCSIYCTRAAIQMVNHTFDGSLTQDEISYRMFAHKNLHMPEGDLGHNMRTNKTHELEAYSFAMQRTITPVDPAHPITLWNDLKEAIDAGKPVLALIWAGEGTHAVVFCGYKGGSLYTVKIMDPWPGFTGWWLYSRLKVARYYLLPDLPDGYEAMEGDFNVSADCDGDSVMNFDEGEMEPMGGQIPRPFDCRVDTSDSDGDQIDDKTEIFSYTFHELCHPGCPHNDPFMSIANIDNDAYRAEGDCDSDNDTLFDGGEDIDGDGYISGTLGETCPFDASEHYVAVSVDKALYAFGEPVHFAEARNFHFLSPYNIEVGVGFPSKVDSEHIAWTDTILTDWKGDASGEYVTTCYELGANYVYIDILSDSLYSEPYNWDPYCWWICDEIPYVGWHPIENLEQYDEEFEWPFDYPSVCPDGGELTTVDVHCPWWRYSESPQTPRDYWLGVSVPMDLYLSGLIFASESPAFVDQIDECSGTEIIAFESNAYVESDLNAQFGDENTYWLGFEISDWQLDDSVWVSDVQLTILQDAIRADDISIKVKMGDSDYGWSPAYYRSISIPAGSSLVCGDADASGGVDIDDVVYLINYIFSGGSPPDPAEAGDADCSGGIDIDDVVYLIFYIFLSGNAPCDIDGDGVPDC